MLKRLLEKFLDAPFLGILYAILVASLVSSAVREIYCQWADCGKKEVVSAKP